MIGPVLLRPADRFETPVGQFRNDSSGSDNFVTESRLRGEVGGIPLKWSGRWYRPNSDSPNDTVPGYFRPRSVLSLLRAVDFQDIWHLALNNIESLFNFILLKVQTFKPVVYPNGLGFG